MTDFLDSTHFKIGVVCAAWAGIINGLVGGYQHITGNERRYLPRALNVSSGYAVPHKLDMKCADLDGDKSLETILEYDGKKFLFKVDQQGRPFVERYFVQPATIIGIPIVPSQTPTQVPMKKETSQGGQ